MTERELKRREIRREREAIQVERTTRKPEDAPSIPVCRVLMAGGVWKVPTKQRPKLAPPPPDGGMVPCYGPDQRKTMLPREPGQRVAPGKSWGYVGTR